MDLRTFFGAKPSPPQPKPELTGDTCESCRWDWSECLCESLVLGFKRGRILADRARRAKEAEAVAEPQPVVEVQVDANAIVRVIRENGPQTSRQLAKALGVHKHDINKIIYAHPDVFERVNAKSVHVPLWGVKDSPKPAPIEKPKLPAPPRVCDDCGCPFDGAGTTCGGCLVRAIPNSVFVECECGRVIVNPTDEQVEAGKDEDGEWWCPKCWWR